MCISCDYCSRPAALVTGVQVYPHRPDLHEKRYWKCSPCGAWVACHAPGGGYGDGTRPLGRLANAELRAARQEAHAAFDLLWCDGHMSRTHAYRWLAHTLDIPSERAHIALFDVAGCRAVVDAVEQWLSRSGIDGRS